MTGKFPEVLNLPPSTGRHLIGNSGRKDIWAKPVEILVFCNSNRLPVDILRVFLNQIWVDSIKSSKMIGKFPTVVLNFLQPVISQTQPVHL